MGDTGSGMMMHDFSDDQNDRFSESYREMDRLNERIRQSNDPEVRGELMHEHIHELQNGMMMINEGWGSSEPDDSRRSDASDQWTRNMEQQMFRMQQMLNQLIDREAIELDNEIE
ncbi:hypothetical protein [Saccharospirillum impatiens]|uniref:hypothetical protein n=1 Tax=Saccharospirillum impatiens TaxID=169438 RepID=UPI00042717AA|nr:hypothetical protein [Saccharospirillum impatiens]